MAATLQALPLGDGRVVALSVEGDTATLALRAPGGEELFALPFRATVAALRDAVGAVARAIARTAAPRPVTLDDLRARRDAAWRRAYEVYPDPDWEGRDTARAVLGEVPDDATLDALLAAGRAGEAAARVGRMERRLAAAERGADPDAVRDDVAVAPPGSFRAFAAALLARERVEHLAPPERIEDVPAYLAELPADAPLTPARFRMGLSAGFGTTRVLLTPEAAAAVPWRALLAGRPFEDVDVELTTAAIDAARDRTPLVVRWGGGVPDTRFALGRRGAALLLDAPKPNGAPHEVVAEHVGLETGLETTDRRHAPRPRRRTHRR